jgi:hypothetical protein
MTIVCKFTAISAAKTSSTKIERRNHNGHCWLVYQYGRMLCKVCIAASQENMFAKMVQVSWLWFYNFVIQIHVDNARK